MPYQNCTKIFFILVTSAYTLLFLFVLYGILPNFHFFLLHFDEAPFLSQNQAIFLCHLPNPAQLCILSYATAACRVERAFAVASRFVYLNADKRSDYVHDGK